MCASQRFTSTLPSISSPCFLFSPLFSLLLLYPLDVSSQPISTLLSSRTRNASACCRRSSEAASFFRRALPSRTSSDDSHCATLRAPPVRPSSSCVARRREEWGGAQCFPSPTSQTLVRLEECCVTIYCTRDRAHTTACTAGFTVLAGRGTLRHDRTQLRPRAHPTLSDITDRCALIHRHRYSIQRRPRAQRVPMVIMRAKSEDHGRSVGADCLISDRSFLPGHTTECAVAAVSSVRPSHSSDGSPQVRAVVRSTAHCAVRWICCQLTVPEA